jgi:hypothetical protein
MKTDPSEHKNPSRQTGIEDRNRGQEKRTGIEDRNREQE